MRSTLARIGGRLVTGRAAFALAGVMDVFAVLVASLARDRSA